MPRVIGLSGSLRARSSTTALLRAAAGVAPPGTELLVYDALAELPHFNPDLDGEDAVPPAPVAALREAVRAADAVIVASPEYAHGVPGSLKNAIDWLVSTDVLSEKPVLLLVVSPSGGHHARAHLAETLTTMYARVLADGVVPALPIGKLRPGADGRVTDPDALAALAAALAALLAAVPPRAPA